MRHTCPDGTHTRLVRDDVPVGILARHSCPRCGWSRDGETILSETSKALGIRPAGHRQFKGLRGRIIEPTND